jgi:hypothetical protein
MRRFGLALGAFSVAASLVGCGTMSTMSGVGTSKFNGLGFTTKNTGAEWTIMLHLAGSNNLEPFAFEDLNEIEAGLKSDKVNFIVLFDGTKKGDSKIMKMVNDPAGYNTKIVSPTVDDKGAVIPADKEIDSGDYKTVSKFVDFTVKNFPAKKYAFMSWDHGSGIFTPQGARVNLGPSVDRMALKQTLRRQNITISPLGFGWDDETGNHVTTAQFTPILETGAKAAGQALDLAGFDACLMAHVEMAYQTKGHAKNLVASEELEPGKGWDYTGWMKSLSANPAADGAGNAAYLVDSYYKSYTPGGNQYGGRQNDITLSNLSYDAVKNELTPALNTLAEDLLAAMPTDKAAYKTARTNAQNFYNSDCADLGSFLDKLTASRVNGKVLSSAKTVRAAYSKAVTAEAHAGTGMAGATGAVVYFPENKWSWKAAYGDPNQIAFAAEKWGKFLAEFIK